MYLSACTDDMPCPHCTSSLVLMMCLIHTAHPRSYCTSAHSLYIVTVFLEIYVLESSKFRFFILQTKHGQGCGLIHLTLHPLGDASSFSAPHCIK